MKNILSNYADSSDSDSESNHKRAKPEETEEAHEDKVKNPLQESKELLNELKEQKEESDSELSEGDFVQRAKRFKRDDVLNEVGEEKSLVPNKPELDDLDPLAKSLFSILPAPKNTKTVKPLSLAKPDIGLIKSKVISQDDDEADLLVSYENVQLPKAKVRYSTDKSTDNKGEEIIELNESELRDAAWRKKYMRPLDEVNKMEEYLNDHRIRKDERSKNQITHLAYQSIKQQVSEIFNKVQKPEKDGRRRYGW